MRGHAEWEEKVLFIGPFKWFGVKLLHSLEVQGAKANLAAIIGERVLGRQKGGGGGEGVSSSRFSDWDPSEQRNRNLLTWIFATTLPSNAFYLYKHCFHPQLSVLLMHTLSHWFSNESLGFDAVEKESASVFFYESDKKAFANQWEHCATISRCYLWQCQSGQFNGGGNEIIRVEQKEERVSA